MQVKQTVHSFRFISLHRKVSVAEGSSRVQVQQFTGYRTRLRARIGYVVLLCVSGGAAWFIAYTFPRAILWTLEECSLADADHVLAKVLP